MLNLYVIILHLCLVTSRAEDYYCEDNGGIATEINLQTSGRHTLYTRIEGENEYRSSLDCRWLITGSSASSRIHFTVESSDLQWAPSRVICTGYDYVKVYSGSTDADPMLSIWCGNENPHSITTNASQALVHFHSNDRDNSQGVVLNFELFDMDPVTGTCPPGWLQGTGAGDISSYCYALMQHIQTFYEAQRHCTYNTGNLLGLDSEEEADFIQLELLGELPASEQVWTGINDISIENQYQCLDGTKLAFTRFPAGHDSDPYLNCVTMRAGDGVWAERDCGLNTQSLSQYKFICKRHKVNPTTVYVIPDGRYEKGLEGTLPAKRIIIGCLCAGAGLVVAVVLAILYRKKAKSSTSGRTEVRSQDSIEAPAPTVNMSGASATPADATAPELPPSYDETLRRDTLKDSVPPYSPS